MCAAAAPSFGEILVADAGRAAIYRIDRSAGATSVFSGLGVGTGPVLKNPHAIAICPDGSVLVSDTGTETMVRIDRTTGNRATLFIPGASLINVYGIAVSASGQVFMADVGTEKISTCLASGAGYTVTATLVAGYNNPSAISLDSTSSYIWIADSNQDSGNKPATVSRLKNSAPSYPTTISGAGYGSGPAMSNVTGITQASDSSVYVCDLLNKFILLVNSSGARTLVSGPGLGTGTTIANPIDLTFDASTQHLLMLESVNGNGFAILDVDPVTGNRSTIQSTGTFLSPARVAVYNLYMDTPPPLVFSGGVITWPVAATNWALQYTPSLTQPSWSTVTSGITASSSSFVYQPSFSEQAGFYQLVRTN